MKRRKISYTRVKTAQGCGLQYSLRYLQERNPDQVPQAFRSGSQFHVHMQQWIKGLIEGGEAVESPLLDEVTEGKFLTWLCKKKSNIGIEIKREKFLNDFVDIVGVADIMIKKDDKPVAIVEIKSYPLPVKEVMRQLSFYAFLFDVQEVAYLSPGFFFSASIPAEVAANDVKKMAEEVLARERNLQEHPPQPEPGGWCCYCPYVLSCPFPHKFANNPGEAVKVYLHAKAKMKAAEEFLRAVAELTDRDVEAEAGSAGFDVQNTLSVDVREFAAKAWQKGLDPFDFLHVDVRSFRKLSKKHEDFSEVAEYVPRVVFRVKGR